MRAWCYVAGPCFLLAVTAAVSAQQNWSMDGAQRMLGNTSGKPVKFKPLDTSKAVAPPPTFGSQKKSFTFKSLVPGWLRSGDTPAQPMTMKALKHSTTPGKSANPSAFNPVKPSTPSQ